MSDPIVSNRERSLHIVMELAAEVCLKGFGTDRATRMKVFAILQQGLANHKRQLNGERPIYESGGAQIDPSLWKDITIA